MKKRSPRLEMNKLEAILFASGSPVKLSDMAKATGLEEKDCRILVDILREALEKRGSGMAIMKLENSYQAATCPRYYPDIEKLYRTQQQVKLTQAQMETLAIVAYRQPVTRQEVSDIRGVNSDAVVSRLVQVGLVEEAGRLRAPGRPILLKTTDAFLRQFQLESVKDLPPLPPVEKEKAETKNEDAPKAEAETKEAGESEAEDT